VKDKTYTNGEKLMNEYDKMRRTSLLSFVFVSAVLLIGGFLMGQYAPGHIAVTMAKQLEEIAKNIQASHSVVHTVWVIFIHNVVLALMMVGAGTLAGLYPVFMIWFNGILVGFIVGTVTQHAHVSEASVILYAILPHGIFELGALLWASALGMHLGFTALQSFWYRLRENLPSESISAGSRGQTRLRWRVEAQYAIAKLPWIVTVLLIAAIIEAAVTPKLIQFGLHIS
jgi:stage II sporulation protein M